MYLIKLIILEQGMALGQPVDWNKIQLQIYEAGYKTEELAILKELEICNYTAFIEEETKLLEWEMILRHKGVKKLSVGKEVLVSRSIGYLFKGWMPTFIYQRIAGVKSSGILEWWNNIISEHLAKVRRNVKRLDVSDKTLNKYYNKKIYEVNEYNSRAFFLIFYLILEMGLMAIIYLLCL